MIQSCLALIVGLTLLAMLDRASAIIGVVVAITLATLLAIIAIKKFNVPFDVPSILFYLSILAFINMPKREYFISLETADLYTWLKIIIRSFILLFFGMLVFFVQKRRLIRQPHIFFFLAYAFLAGISTAYSSHQFLSITRFIELSSFIVMVLIVVERSISMEEAFTRLYFGLALIVIFIWAAYFIDPSYVMKPRFSGGTLVFQALGGRLINPNLLSSVAGILLVASLNKLLNYRRPLFFRICYVMFISVLVVTLYKSFGRSAIIGTAVASVFVILSIRKSRFIRVVFIIAILFPIILFVGAFSFENFLVWFLKGDSVDSMVTATGRTVIWKDILLYLFPESPFIGFGFQTMGPDGIFFHSPSGITFTMAHNSFLQTLIGLGLIGLTCLLLSLGFFFRKIFQNLANRSAKTYFLFVEVISLMIVILFDSITDYGIAGLSNPVMLTFIVLMFAVAKYSGGGGKIALDNSR